MSDLSELLEIPGARIAGEFARDGRLIRHESREETTADRVAMAARFGATVSMVLGTLAAGFSELSGLPLVPDRGWIYSGGEWTGMVSGNTFTMLETADSPFASIEKAERGSLAELLEVPGVVDVGEFDAQGGLLAHETRIGLSEELAATGARFTNTVTTSLDGLGEAFGTLTQRPWSPQRGWLYSGGDFTVVSSARRWALFEASAATLTEAYAAVLAK